MSKCSMERCSRKLSLIPFSCKCEKDFCNIHRMPESHNCLFDYKTEGRKYLEKQNISVTFEKVIKI